MPVLPTNLAGAPNIRLLYSEDAEHIAIFAPYNEEFIADLKANLLPRPKWFGQLKCWTVTKFNEIPLRNLLFQYYGTRGPELLDTPRIRLGAANARAATARVQVAPSDETRVDLEKLFADMHAGERAIMVAMAAKFMKPNEMADAIKMAFSEEDVVEIGKTLGMTPKAIRRVMSAPNIEGGQR